MELLNNSFHIVTPAPRDLDYLLTEIENDLFFEITGYESYDGRTRERCRHDDCALGDCHGKYETIVVISVLSNNVGSSWGKDSHCGRGSEGFLI